MTDLSPPSGARQNGRIAMIAGGSIERDAKLARLVTLAGCMPISVDEDQPADFLLTDLSSKTDRLSDFLSHITIYLQTHHSIALIWSKMEALEYIYAALPHGQCHFLVDADDIEAMPILAGVFGRGGMDRLHDRDHDVEFGSLHRISDELAEFARTLARMVAAVPPTTTLRWITAMTDSGMLVRRQDLADARRVFIELSADTFAKMDDYFVAGGARSAPIV